MFGARSSITSIAAAGLVASCSIGSVAATELTGDAILQALKTGGYVIYLRHAMSDTTRGDADPIDVNDCSTQRPLSDQGRVQARKIGAAFQAIGIPVHHVFSSPYCRAVETAALAFPRADQKVVNVLFYSLALPKEDANSTAAQLQKMLAAQPGAGTNTVLVGHTSNLKEAAGVWPKKEGTALVFRPDGKGAFVLVGSVEPTDFERFGS